MMWLESTAYDRLIETGGLAALAWLVVEKAFALLSRRRGGNGASAPGGAELDNLRLRRAISDELRERFAERDIHIREIIHEELDRRLGSNSGAGRIV